GGIAAPARPSSSLTLARTWVVLSDIENTDDIPLTCIACLILSMNPNGSLNGDGYFHLSVQYRLVPAREYSVSAATMTGMPTCPSPLVTARAARSFPSVTSTGGSRDESCFSRIELVISNRTSPRQSVRLKMKYLDETRPV